MLEQLATEVEGLSAHVGRPLSLIAESDLNDARLVTAREAGGYGLTAQWYDDVHHSLHTTLTGEGQGYYADFATAGLTGLAHVLDPGVPARGHVVELPAAQPRRARSTPRRIPGHRFVVYLQNHDQIGNRATGDRLTPTLSPGLLACGAALVFTSAFTPMLFMGEEWGARTPWQFFSHFPDAGLRDAVREGRTAEFAEHGWGDTVVPDPQRRVHLPRLQARLDRAGAEPHATLLRCTASSSRCAGLAGADRPVARRRGGGRRRRGAHPRRAPWPDPGGVQPRGHARLDPGRPDRCHPAGFGAR